MKKILVVDDHEIIRNGISYYFNDNDKFIIGGEASDGIDALEKLENESFDILLTDISMPRMDGIALIPEVKKKYPEIKIIALTMHGEAHIIRQMIDEKIDGYVLKNSGKELLFEALDDVVNGEEYFDEKVTKALMEDVSKKSDKGNRLASEVKLSARELEIIKLIAEEHSNQEIADKLAISIRSVEIHKENLLRKTGAKNDAGLARFAIERNLS